MLRAECGAVNDVAIVSHNNLNFRGIPFTLGLYVEQPTDCAHAWLYIYRARKSRHRARVPVGT